MFSDIFNSLIDNVQETDAVKTEKQYLLATGQLDNPAEWSIAAYKYQVATSFWCRYAAGHWTLTVS